MIEMVMLNKNIPIDEAKKMVSDGQKKRRNLIGQMLANADELKPEQRAQYISSCMPFIVMI